MTSIIHREMVHLMKIFFDEFFRSIGVNNTQKNFSIPFS
jgi:hypothetical protein